MKDSAYKLSSGERGDGVQIGAIRIIGRAMLAPMSGITDLAMRRIARRHGAALVFTEMVAADAYARGDLETRLRAEGGGLDPHVVQIAGCRPSSMAEAARIAADCGAAIIDINMGCPAKQVTSGYAGSHLMRDLSLALALIRATVRSVTIPVTLKMRLGWNDASLNAAELGRIAEAEGIAMLSVHGRTRCQFYQGRADWRAIRDIKAAVAIPVVANGDCASPADAQTMLAQSEADAVMIGRAAVGRPWLVGDIAHFLETGAKRGEPSLAVRRDAALEHYEGLLEALGADQGVRHARKHLAAYAKRSGSRRAAALSQSLVTADDPRTVRSLLRDVFEPGQQAEAA